AKPRGHGRRRRSSRGAARRAHRSDDCAAQRVMPGATPIGMGCMRLSTDADRDEERAISVLHAALDAGVTLLDTADAYCRDEHDIGHNERLIATALASAGGGRSRGSVSPQGGPARAPGRWGPR